MNMRWILASERNPDKEGYYYSYRNEGKSYKQMAYWYAGGANEWSTHVFEWLDESESSSHSPLQDEIIEVKRSLLAQLKASVEKDGEIKNLKLLIGYAHQIGFSRGQTSNTTIEESWQKFKTDNNL